MFDGVAAAIERALQANAVVSVAGDFPAPSMRLIDDRLEFLHRQRRLRHELSVLIEPGAMRHVHLDPIGAVIELFARRLARFDGPVDELRPLRHGDLRRVVIK